MNIGIDARLLERRITGIGRSLILLLKEIPKHDTKNKYYLFSYDSLTFDKSFYTNVKTFRSFLPQKLFSPIWCNFILPYYLKKNKIDILFSVNQVIPLIKIKNCKYISVVHDVIYKADPDFLPFIYRKYLQLFAFFSIKKSDLIITVSEYSKKDILKNYNINERKIKVIPQSANQEFQPIEISDVERRELKKLFNLRDFTVLYVGMIENRKNIVGIIRIADEIKKLRSDIGFLLVGKIGYGGAKLLREIKKRTNVTYLSNIDDPMLKKIYNLADVFLFPSFYEGFGYPPLEAMQCGLPVIASNNTSLNEIVGEGGLLFDPLDYHFFVRSIIELINNKKFYNAIKQKGIDQSKRFDVRQMVESLITTFNQLNPKS